MNKTRMGKRAASLLLSLVMMLSLLPTAAYAAMADGVETQGAIVSENGTGVSDDSNSSGGTGDLQVEDSEGNGDTGAQQVGDSSGSGTADDTTGAEGGADPTDSVNGNDSADPQDDGDAVMPVASSVVSTSEELVAAIAAANDGDTITLGEGEFTTYGNTSPKKSLTFVGAGTGTVWTIGNLSKDVKGEGNGDCSFDGCETITFQNMTLKSDGADYRGFIRISNTAVKKCTLVGKTAYWGYETAKFEDSTFNAPVGDYALWDYSTKAMTFEGCTFNISGKGVNVYVEQPSTDARTVEVNGCTVNSDKAGKAFLNIKNSTRAFDVTLSGTNTVTGLEANGTTGSALYQVETTEVTETTGKPVAVKAKADDGTVTTLYEVKETVEASVAEVNGAKYKSLTEAIGAAQDGQTVTLLADATEDVVISKSITLDLGGKTLTNTNVGKATISVQSGTVTVKNGNVVGGTGYYNIEAKKDANLTLTDVTATAGNTGSSMIDNYGTLTITSGTYTGGLNVVKSEEGSKLTITGGTFTLNYAPSSGYTAVILVYGDTTISGGEFIQTATPKWGYPQVVMTGVEEGYTAITRVTGGHFVNKKSGDNIFHGYTPATADNFEVSGGTFNKYVSDSYMADGFIPTKNADGTYGVKEGKFVAEVGSTGYETFDEAIAAANASTKSATIYLRENITVDHQLVIENAKGKAITLNLESFTLTSTYAINKAIKNGSYALVNITPLTIKNGTFAAGQARAIGALETLTLNGATVTQQLTGGHACVAFCADGKSYTIKNSTIDGAYAVCSFADNATINITGSTLIGTGNTLYHNGTNYGLKLTVKDTTITSSGSCGVYISGSTSAQSNADNQNGAGKYQQATFTGCTISGAINGVEVKYTDLTLDGCTVSTTAKDASYKQDNNGPAGSGFAVVSTDNAMNNVTPKPEGTIIIKGTGKYTGPVGLGSLKSVKETYADFADETIKISGGTFTTEVPAAYCADGFIPTQNDDGTYGVKEGKFVAEIGSTKYETLAEAVAAAEDGQTVTLLADVADCGSLTISKNITLDGGGHTISGNSSISVNMPGNAAADVTIKNVTFKDIANGNKLSAFYFS